MSTEPTWRTWLALRWTVITHPRAVREEMALLTRGKPWYAAARPLAIVQHWAPHPLMPVTFCGKFAGERSTSEIRTLMGWHCKKCHRRAKRALRALREAS